MTRLGRISDLSGGVGRFSSNSFSYAFSSALISSGVLNSRSIDSDDSLSLKPPSRSIIDIGGFSFFDFRFARFAAAFSSTVGSAGVGSTSGSMAGACSSGY